MKDCKRTPALLSLKCKVLFSLLFIKCLNKFFFSLDLIFFPPGPPGFTLILGLFELRKVGWLDPIGCSVNGWSAIFTV